MQLDVTASKRGWRLLSKYVRIICRDVRTDADGHKDTEQHRTTTDPPASSTNEQTAACVHTVCILHFEQ